MSDIRLEVGARLILLRKSAKMRQSDVAAHLGLSTGAYQKYENGKGEAGYTALIYFLFCILTASNGYFCRL